MGFIDGDLIESFLDLHRDKQQEVVQGLQVNDESNISVDEPKLVGFSSIQV